MIECKKLNGFMCKKINGKYCGKYIELKSTNQFRKLEVIRDIDGSPSGILKLVIDSKTRKSYMIKEIDLEFSSSSKQRAAECEVEYLKVIRGPTIIKFQGSYVENNKI